MGTKKARQVDRTARGAGQPRRAGEERTDRAPDPLPAPDAGASRKQLAGLLAALAAYFLVHLAALGRIPAGMCNDAAEEGLRSILLVAQRRVEIITFVLGNSAETLWLYAVGLLSALIGPTREALVLPTALAAAASVGLVTIVARRLRPALPIWIPVAVSATSPWLFHYGQSGFRACSSLLFVPLVALFVHDAEERPSRAVAAGALAALSVYFYTSNRLLPVALAAAFLVRWWCATERRPAVFRAALLAGAAGLLVSVPNIAFLLRNPSGFLSRGIYYRPPSVSAAFSNFAGSLLFPFWYPDWLRKASMVDFGEDRVSSSFAGAGFEPVGLPIALAFVLGCWVVRERSRLEASFLLLVALLSTLFLGAAGPSLTRFLLVLPVLLAFASAGLGEAVRRGRTAAGLVGAGLLALALWRGTAYTRAFSSGGPGSQWLGESAVAVALRAEELAAKGQRVLCVVGESANTVRFMTFRHTDRVSISEFDHRPFSPGEIPLRTFQPDVILVEARERFLPWAARLGSPQGPAGDPRFLELPGPTYILRAP